MSEIETERLRVVALTMEQLQRYLTDRPRLERQLGVSLSQGVITQALRRAIAIKLTKMAQVPPSHHDWYTYWLMIVNKDAFGAGLIGFKGYPSPAGEAELGYGIDPGYRNQGYTTEAVQALIGWAFQHPECTSVIGEVKKTNPASSRVLEKAGMRLFYETEDAIYWMIRKQLHPASGGVD
jgi:ribosomal-protein-alanine N-acetyltransferase